MIKAGGISEFGVWERLCFVEFYKTCSDARGRFLAMSKIDEYRANATECNRMARTARDEKDRQTWQGMADFLVMDGRTAHRRQDGRARLGLQHLICGFLRQFAVGDPRHVAFDNRDVGPGFGHVEKEVSVVLGRGVGCPLRAFLGVEPILSG